jgi:hypothetical protein
MRATSSIRHVPGALLVAIVLLGFGLNCSGDKEPPPTPTLFPELEASPGPTAVPPAVPTERPPLTEVPGVIWLIDVAAATVVTLDADPEHSVANAWFDDETGTAVYDHITAGQVISVRTELDGTEIERVDYIQPPFAGPPQTRWKLDRVGAGEIGRDGAVFGLSDLWVEDTRTGARTLLASGLWQCTQCDAFSSPEWSPSGRYVTYREHGGDGRVFVSDVQAGTTREITVDRVDRDPQWSPAADLLIRPSLDGVTLLEDVSAGTQTALVDMPWPASFDPTGAYLYSLALGSETAIANGTTGEPITSLAGAAVYDALNDRQPWPFAPDSHPVVGTANGFVAAVGGVASCRGTLLYVNEAPLSCAEGAGSAVFSPDGSQVILARKTGETGRVEAPTIQAIGLDIYEVLVVDMTTGDERVLAQGALGFGTAPRVVWNAAGTHILVSWPNNE